MSSKRLMVAAVTAVLIAGLGACGQGDDTDAAPTRSTGVGQGGGSGSEPGPDKTADATVFGLRDQMRHLSAKTTRATRPHTVKKCSTSTRRVKHTKSTGSGTRRKTRTWYSTERVKSCRWVHKGTETYKRVVRPEQWCVSLDNVGGDAAKDDVWYQVRRTTYDEAIGKDEHTRMEFTPKHTGC
ncbi:hypothetical protein [Streptomyces sp. NPDC002580]|uniref:hypothetical protein n=1 Tax=Streptomyces sp. NPDC002580 TaxID=3364653 RepID=UPI0036CA1B02